MDVQEQLLNDTDELVSRGLFDGVASGWDQLATMVKVDVEKLIALLMTFVVFATSEEPGRVIQSIGSGIQKEIVAVKTPIDETIASVGSSQCSNVKKLFGVSYEQLEGEREPDLNQLTLFYRTRLYNQIFNLTNSIESLRETRMVNPPEKLVIFVHGFTDNPWKDSFTNISESFLKSDEGDRITLLALDGSSLIRWLYIRATTYVIFMGEKLAEFLVGMVHIGLDPSKIHMVGHSLGAHICGFTGKQFYKLTGKKIGRITGLDPAGPCFTNVETNFRLNENDAEYVDVIHTDAGVYGIRSPVGHADYFPNKGEQQPECLLQTCSHSRAWLLCAESVLRRDAFPALRCASWEAFTQGKCYDEISYMGYASKPTRGLFFLQTGGKYPFGLGLAGIKYRNNVGVVRNLQSAVGNVPVVNKLPILG